jgi:hypothetical protein
MRLEEFEYQDVDLVQLVQKMVHQRALFNTVKVK